MNPDLIVCSIFNLFPPRVGNNVDYDKPMVYVSSGQDPLLMLEKKDNFLFILVQGASDFTTESGALV